MAEPWFHALSLNRAVVEGGVRQARIAQADYEGVKPLMRQVWQGERWQNLRETIRSQGAELIPAQVLLGYLRGYFLYREVPENDHAFWPNFLRDLGIPDRKLPRPVEYDRLWEAIVQHGETKAHLKFHENGQRDFIGTLDAIFHFKALRLSALKDAFLKFYQTGELSKEARPYERVFQRLREALDFLLAEHDIPNLRDEEQVLNFLEGAGVFLGEPNPVRLLFNRSEQALEDLYCRLRQERPTGERKQKSSRFRHKQVKVELLKPCPLLEEIQPTLSREPLLEGWTVYGKVTLEDGRFARFSWAPRFTPEGLPIPEELEVPFDDGVSVHFRLHHQAFAVRFSEQAWILGGPLEVRPVNFDLLHHPLRFLLASGGEARENLPELVQEHPGESAAVDTLIVEVRTDGRGGDWRRIATLPVEVRAQLKAWVESEGVFVRTDPPGFAVQARVLADGRVIRDERLVTASQGTLAARAELVPVQVEIRLGEETCSLSLPPKGWPRSWWRLGLALASSVRAGQEP